MREAVLREIFDKTSGRCHFCGDRIVFKNRGYPKAGETWVGHWEADHVLQTARGGPNAAENCLAACTRCNRLRWNRRGREVRQLMLIGLIGFEEISKRSPEGVRIQKRLKQRLEANRARRII